MYINRLQSPWIHFRRVSWVELCHPKRYVEVPLSGTCECLPWNRIFAGVIELRMGHIGLNWALSPIINVLIRERRDAHIHREEGYVKTEVDTRLMLPQTKENPRLPATSSRERQERIAS